MMITGLPGSGKSTVAEQAAGLLDATLLAHDWAMSGLRPYPDLQNALDGMQPVGHGPVGWSILRGLARSELRRGQSVVLDGVARAGEIERGDQLALEEGSRLVVVLVECPDTDVHRLRIESRKRAIPDWYELTWDDVERSKARWSPPNPIDLRLDSTSPREANRELLSRYLAG
jgi:predicted kinase